MAIKIGIIAEDKSDVDVVTAFAKSLAAKTIQTKWFKGDGCGKIHAKCHSWAEALRLKGCSVLILLHDLDEKKVTVLHKSLTGALMPSPISKFIIAIPIRELEAWLLCDNAAITSALKLKKAFPRIANPETIFRPKERLRDLVYSLSQQRITYVTTIHNPKIAEKASIEEIAKRCASFLPLKQFLETHLA